MSEFYWRVSQLVQYLKLKLDVDERIQNIFVEGEISNFTHHNSGHMYFSLKDEHSSIRCVMFASQTKKVDFPLHNGDSVLLQAKTSVFESQGQLQLYVQRIEPSGVGALYLKLEELKKKLSAEGIFEPDRKQALPKFPLRIGLITGDNTAAKKDVLSTLKRRWPVAAISEYNALMQGEKAYLTIIDALKKADQDNQEVLLLVRGGGSLEDLWNFNEEALVRCIADLHTPLISGVGHETDTTLVDYVADCRAATPTAAAELAAPLLSEVKSQLAGKRVVLIGDMQQRYDNLVMKLDYLRSRSIYQKPENIYLPKSMQLQQIKQRLNYWSQNLHEKRLFLNESLFRLPLAFRSRLTVSTAFLHETKKVLNSSILLKSASKQNKFQIVLLKLDAYSPLNTLKRGFSIATVEGRLIKSVTDVALSEKIETRVVDGKVYSTVISKESDYEKK